MMLAETKEEATRKTSCIQPDPKCGRQSVSPRLQASQRTVVPSCSLRHVAFALGRVMVLNFSDTVLHPLERVCSQDLLPSNAHTEAHLSV